MSAVTLRNLPEHDGALPPDAPEWIRDIDNPYLHGVYAPTTREVSASGLEVTGRLPHDLHGLYVRNGPNPVHAPPHRHHWFDGDAWLAAIRFERGEASFQSRWVHTKAFEMEREAGHAIWPGVLGPYDFTLPIGPIKDTANTDITWFRGRLLALWYDAGTPYAVDPLTLDTLGPEDFDGQLDQRLSAHSKPDERTGELLFFNYSHFEPWLGFGVIDAAGRMVHRTRVELPGPRLPHDIGFTERYVILHDLPFFHDVELLRDKGKRIATFREDMPSRFGVLPRDADGSEVRWFEAQAGYVLHVINAWEEGDEIVMDGFTSTNPLPRPDPEDGSLKAMLAYLRLEASMHRWRFNLGTGETREHPLDDTNAEFPIINNTRAGLPTRYSWSQVIPPARTLTFSGLMKFDSVTGRRQLFDYGPGVYGSEAAFAPRPGAVDEDDGYVTTFVTDTADWSSWCLVFDARDIAAGPLARVRIPQRLPAGFHATWVDGARLDRR